MSNIFNLKKKIKTEHNNVIITKNTYGDVILKAEKKDNPSNYFTIIESKEIPNHYTINITKGTIDLPKKSPNATWWDLYDKCHNENDVLIILKRYTIL